MNTQTIGWPCLALVLLSATAQGGVVQGQVKTVDGKPLAGAMVTAFDPQQKRRDTVYSDATGNFVLRVDFAGKLTGHYRDYGKYAWRWYLMAELTNKPLGYLHEAVWCDEASLVMADEVC